MSDKPAAGSVVAIPGNSSLEGRGLALLKQAGAVTAVGNVGVRLLAEISNDGAIEFTADGTGIFDVGHPYDRQWDLDGRPREAQLDAELPLPYRPYRELPLDEDDGAFVLRDARSGQVLRKFGLPADAPPGAVLMVEFSSDGLRVIEALLEAEDHAPVRVWDSVSGQLLFELPSGGDGWFVEQGGLLAIRQDRGSVSLWSLDDGASKGTLVQRGSGSIFISVSPDASRVLTTDRVTTWLWAVA